MIPFSYEPFTTVSGDSFTVTCIFEDGQVATFTQSTIADGVAFTAGTHNYMNATLSGYTTSGSGVNSGKISSYSTSSYPAEGTDIWIVTDDAISSADSYTTFENTLKVAKTAGRTIEVVFLKLKSVVARAFDSCSSLTSISLPAATTIGGYALYNCYYLTSISLPVATKIENIAFQYCTRLTSVSLPVAEEFGTYAFSHCHSLTSVWLPVATKFGDYALDYCYSLTSIELPKVETFGDYAFSGCTSFTSISLGVDGNGISSIGADFCNNVSTSGIDLTIKLAASSNCSVNGNTLNVNGVEYEFQSITQIY